MFFVLHPYLYVCCTAFKLSIWVVNLTSEGLQSGLEVGTFKFSNYKPIGGEFSGVHITGILSFPAGPGQVKIGGGMIGKGFGFIAENSYGFAIGDALDIRIGVRSTTALNVTDTNNNILGTVSWMDGLIVLGVSL